MEWEMSCLEIRTLGDKYLHTSERGARYSLTGITESWPGHQSCRLSPVCLGYSFKGLRKKFIEVGSNVVFLFPFLQGGTQDTSFYP